MTTKTQGQSKLNYKKILISFMKEYKNQECIFYKPLMTLLTQVVEKEPMMLIK